MIMLRLNQERMNSRNQCAALAAELTSLIQEANAPIFAVDPSGMITQWNHKTQELTGIQHSEAVGQDLSDLLK
jgi:PAS domain S-box-containing protein